MKSFCFTVDDNIRCLREIVDGGLSSIFDHPYLSFWRRLHEEYGAKVQLNLFYNDRDTDFNLSRFPDAYKSEWQKNADWLKLSFHSKANDYRPYEQSGYDEVYKDCKQVHEEILRFAGAKSLAKTTTIHFARMTAEGVKAVQDLGVQGLLGEFGTDEKPRTPYDCDLADSVLGRTGAIVYRNGMAHAGIDCILNKYTIEEILSFLESLKDREFVRIMIHEQHFFSDYPQYYQPNFREKVFGAVAKLSEYGYESKFFEELI